jgi:hypothetical protein
VDALTSDGADGGDLDVVDEVLDHLQGVVDLHVEALVVVRGLFHVLEGRAIRLGDPLLAGGREDEEPFFVSWLTTVHSSIARASGSSMHVAAKVCILTSRMRLPTA